ncbi:hypothetical protein F511_11901 [Dorcoceras hygrometricum]|uniref:Uncharacterized protein n=1 Tax=Dorcoceras hygrometricum TaxID=472368 RepID=A0A2Z7B091_9LAMI|nr:hypothetical protein F511_11901 [Dorcoceras hygrometricum]
MASSLFVNTLQVEFESVLAMEHTGMTRMFKSLEDTGLRGFLEEGECNKRTEDTASNTDGGETQPAQPAVTETLAAAKEKGNERTNIDQGVQRGGDDRNEENLESDTQMNHKYWVNKGDIIETEASTFQRKQVFGPNDRAIVVMPKQLDLHTIVLMGQGIFSLVKIRDFDWVTCFLSKIDPTSKVKETLVVMNNPIPVKEHCRLMLNSSWENISTRMKIFDEWFHFRKEVRIKDVLSFDHLVQIEEQLLAWGETEQVLELIERRSFIMYKFYELEVQELYNEHLANFKLDVPSVKHDYLYIQLLNKDLKEIATLHRARRVIAGLPIVDPEASFIGSASDQPQLLALEFSNQAEQERAVLLSENQQVLLSGNQQDRCFLVRNQQFLLSEDQQVLLSEDQQVLLSEDQQVLLSEDQQLNLFIPVASTAELTNNCSLLKYYSYSVSSHPLIPFSDNGER